jgi:septin 7
VRVLILSTDPIELVIQYYLQIMEEMKKNGIQLYEFPETTPQSVENGGLKENVKQEHQNGTNIQNQMHQHKIPQHQPPPPPQQQHDQRKRLPFAVVGSTHVKETLVGGDRATKNRIRVREYPWGTVEVDNLAHNDFVALRDMVIRQNLIDLIATTQNVHYENYRNRSLPKNNFDNDPFTQLEQETREKQQEAEETRQTKEMLFKERVAAREQRLLEKAEAVSWNSDR